MDIHPNAVVHPDARIAQGVTIGPGSVIGPEVEIGPGTQISSCVRIVGQTVIGENNRIFHGAVIGEQPQDLAFKGETSQVIIGNNNIIREYATIHRATGEARQTLVGDNNMIMAYVHLGHNVTVRNNAILVNSVQLGGYAEIQDHAYLSAFSAVHQFARIGKHAIVGASSRVNQDVPPFMMALGYEAEIVGVNRIGLRRRGFSPEQIDNIVEAYRILYRSGLATDTALARLEQELGHDPNIKELIEFFATSNRGVIKKARKSARK